MRDDAIKYDHDLMCIEGLRPASKRAIRIRGSFACSAIALLLGIAFLCAEPAYCSSCGTPPSIAAKLKSEGNAAAYSELGAWRGDHRQFACAAQAFQAALNLQPGSAHLAYMLGLSLYSSGDAGGAVVALRQAVKLDPQSLDAHLTLAMALDELKEHAGSEVEWRAALAIDPGSAVALETLSKDLLSEGDFDAVIDLLEPRAGSAELKPEIAVNLGVAYSESGRPEDAARMLRACLQLHPSSSSVAKALAAALVLLHRTQDAVTVLDAALKLHPGDADIQALYLHTLMLNGDNAKAQQVGPAMLARSPRNAELLYLNGDLEQQTGNYAAARRHLELAATLSPDNFEYRHSLGSVLTALHDYLAAKRQFELAEKLRPDDPGVHFEMANVMRAMGSTEEARAQMELYQQMLKAQSDRAQAASKAELGDHSIAVGNPSEAAGFYQAALAFNPKDALLAYKLAMALDKAGDTAGEQAALQKAIEINPGMALAQNQLGYLASRDGDLSTAEMRFRLAVHASARNAKAWMNLAATLFLESKWQEAGDAIAHVLQLDPANVAARQLKEQLDAIQTPH